MEGLEDRVQELSGDVALLRIQLARAQAEKQTLAQRLQRLQGPRVHVGRGRHAGVCLHHNTVARDHCQDQHRGDKPSSGSVSRGPLILILQQRNLLSLHRPSHLRCCTWHRSRFQSPSQKPCRRMRCRAHTSWMLTWPKP